MARKLNNFSQSTPIYLGSKRKLNQFIFGRINGVLPQCLWSESTLIDLFAGSGSVSLFAKAQGFGSLHCNDQSARSQIVLNALVANHSTLLSEMDLLRLFQPILEAGFVEREFAGSVFTFRHARVLDMFLANLQEFQAPVKQELGRLLLWHFVPQCVAFGTSIGTSNRPCVEVLEGKSNWWDLNHKRFQDGSFQHLIEPVWPKVVKIRSRINQGVFGSAGPVHCYRENALELISKLDGHVLYLDPPYPGTSGYERENAVLDAVLFGRYPSVDIPISPFTRDTEALSELLSESRHIPIWVISYGNKMIDLDGLMALVRKVRRKHEVMGWSKDYQHMAYVSKNTKNQELLVISITNEFNELIKSGRLV